MRSCLVFDNTTNTAGSFDIRGSGVDMTGIASPVQSGVVLKRDGAVSNSSVADTVLDRVSS